MTNIKPLCVLFALGALLTAASAHALDCNNAVTTVDMNECAARTQKDVEANLNRVYQRVLKTVSAPRVRTQFVSAQRLWVKFREADCQTVYQQHADGTMRNLAYLGCLQNRAETRIKELEMFGDER